MDQKTEVEKFLKTTLRVTTITPTHYVAVNHIVSFIARRKEKDVDAIYAGYVEANGKLPLMQKRKFVELFKALKEPKNGSILNRLMAIPLQTEENAV